MGAVGGEAAGAAGPGAGENVGECTGGTRPTGTGGVDVCKPVDAVTAIVKELVGRLSG